MPFLRPAEDFHDRAQLIFRQERALLAARGVPGELSLTGGTSVPGALTKGDVDLHHRVVPDHFAAAVDRLRDLHAVVFPEIWQPTLATFAIGAELPTGLAATPIGSEHDRRFTRTWQLLAAHPELLAEYNAMKMQHIQADDATYRHHKSLFFDRLLELWPEEPLE